MHLTKLSTSLRAGFAEALANEKAIAADVSGDLLLDGLRLDDLPRLVQDPAIHFQQQDRILAAVVRRYQAGPSSLWAPILLAMLAPTLVRIASSVRPLAGWVSEDDIDQQVVIGFLEVARRLRLPEPPTHIERRLRLRVMTRMARWLRRTIRGQSDELAVAAWRAIDEHYRQTALFELTDLAHHPEFHSLLRPLYRSVVWRQTLVEIASADKTSPATVRGKKRRSVAHVRNNRAA